MLQLDLEEESFYIAEIFNREESIFDHLNSSQYSSITHITTIYRYIEHIRPVIRIVTREVTLMEGFFCK